MKWLGVFPYNIIKSVNGERMDLHYTDKEMCQET